MKFSRENFTIFPAHSILVFLLFADFVLIFFAFFLVAVFVFVAALSPWCGTGWDRALELGFREEHPGFL